MQELAPRIEWDAGCWASSSLVSRPLWIRGYTVVLRTNPHDDVKILINSDINTIHQRIQE